MKSQSLTRKCDQGANFFGGAGARMVVSSNEGTLIRLSHEQNFQEESQRSLVPHYWKPGTDPCSCGQIINGTGPLRADRPMTRGAHRSHHKAIDRFAGGAASPNR
jgi:hypothetical protein